MSLDRPADVATTWAEPRTWTIVVDTCPPRTCSATIVGAPGTAPTAPELDNPYVTGVVMNDGTCSVDGCDSHAWARGWCNTHYGRWHRFGDPLGSKPRPSPSARFWAKVDKAGPTDCWLWTAGVGGLGGYGRFRAHGRKYQAHRWSYEELIGPIPEGLHLDHLCRTPRCVNPAHLEPVTNRENFLRGEAPTAVAVRNNCCVRGHTFTEDNTYINPAGGRACRACKRLRYHARRAAGGRW